MKADGTDAAKTKPPATVNQSDSVGALIKSLTPQLERALPKHVTPDRMARVALTAIRQSPKLAQCDKYSLIAAVMVSAQLGLEPNTPLGQAFLIPYGGKAQFQIGYKGILDLAHRSKQYRRISAYVVDEADDFDYCYGLDPRLEHTPARQPSGKSIYYYAIYELDNGGRDFRVWSREQVEAHARQYSQAYKADKKDSPWFTAFDQMAKKTVLVDVLRYAPKSIEVADATRFDGASLSINPNDPELSIEAEYEVQQEDMI